MERWAQCERHVYLDPHRLVFVDTNGASVNMARRDGRCRRSARRRMNAPHGRWEIDTFIAGLRNSGMVVPLVSKRPVNRTIFEGWLERMLVSVQCPGDILATDNLSRHKGLRVRALIKAAGAEFRHLPPHRPGFNPIRTASTMLNVLLLEEAAGTIDASRCAIVRLINPSHQTNAANVRCRSLRSR